MASSATTGNATISSSASGSLLLIEGDWVLGQYPKLIGVVKNLAPKVQTNTQIDVSKLGAFDTAGANLLFDLIGEWLENRILYMDVLKNRFV